MRNVLTVLFIAVIFLFGCSSHNKATFKEEAIEQHYKVALAFADGHDHDVDQTSADNLKEALNWIRTAQATTEEERIIISVINDEVKYATLYIAASLMEDYGGIRENMIMYASARTAAQKILGIE